MRLYCPLFNVQNRQNNYTSDIVVPNILMGLRHVNTETSDTILSYILMGLRHVYTETSLFMHFLHVSSQWMPPVEYGKEKTSKLHTQKVPPDKFLSIAYCQSFCVTFLILQSFVSCLLLCLPMSILFCFL